jgi:hypothetical protein
VFEEPAYLDPKKNFFWPIEAQGGPTGEAAAGMAEYAARVNASYDRDRAEYFWSHGRRDLAQEIVAKNPNVGIDYKIFGFGLDKPQTGTLWGSAAAGFLKGLSQAIERGSKDAAQKAGGDGKKAKDPFESVRTDFKNFLNTMSSDCKNSLQSYLGNLSSRADTVQFYDLDAVQSNGEPLGYETADTYVGIFNAPDNSDTLYGWFAKEHPNGTDNAAVAVFAGPRIGIYFDGARTSFKGGNLYLLLHEMMHMVTTQGDVALANTLGVTVGQQQTASAALSTWFNNGCK